jgi:hypothetical protein
VFNTVLESRPPQTIISLPIQTGVCPPRQMQQAVDSLLDERRRYVEPYACALIGITFCCSSVFIKSAMRCECGRLT